MTGDAGKLRWRCRRGAKELDALLNAYLEHRYALAPPAQQAAFRSLLELADPDLLELLLGIRSTDDPITAGLIEQIRDAADH